MIQRLVAKLQRDGLLVADPSQQQHWLDDSDTTATATSRTPVPLLCLSRK
jgi:hypothetical protein